MDEIYNHFFGVVEKKGYLIFFEIELEKAFLPCHPFVFEEVRYGFYEMVIVHVPALIYSVFIEFVDCGMDGNTPYEVDARFLF